jgi:hypothetical protein
MLGGGVFVTQNKTLPGSYINFVSLASANATLGERGTVAIALPLNKAAGTVIELTRAEFVANCKELTGAEYSANAVAPLREIFVHANKVYVYDLGVDKTASDAVNAFEPYEFNVLCAYTSEVADVNQYITTVKSWRDDMGKKCQVVVYNQTSPNHEGVINVVSTVAEGDAHALVAWVAGAEAGCKINESCTNMLYDGEYTIVTDKTQSQLEDCIEAGQIAFHLVYGDVRLLEDVSSLTETTADKGEDFKSNQTIRVIDQIANDIAKLFNVKYLGKIQNNASGRVSLWGDIVKHHKELEALGAIENFNAELLKVEQGANKKSVVVTDVVTVVNSMAQLYMTVVVQ